MTHGTLAHSVVAPGAMSRRIAGALVILSALISMVPLVWIVLTSFKTPTDSISYPPKILFAPSLEGYVNLFTTRTRQTATSTERSPSGTAVMHGLPSTVVAGSIGASAQFNRS